MLRRITSNNQIIRLLFITWMVSLVIGGCSIQKKLIPPPEPSHFITIVPKDGDSLSDITREYLSDSSLSFRISEFNNINTLYPDQALVVPLKPLYPYGLRSTGFQTVPVLSYHAFSWKTSNYMTVREKDFEAQMKYLKTNGYHVVSLSQMLELFDGKELPKKAVVITIDDGWGSTYRIAYPILKKYGYPFTLFIQTNLINKAYKTLDWSQIREMLQNSKLEVGCHTKVHRDLTQPKHGESFKKYFASIRKELKTAKNIILKETGKDPIHLAYPYGRTNQLVIDLLKDSGYISGYTIIRDSNSILTNPFRLNRSMIYGTYSLEKFKQQLNTFEYFDLLPEQLDDEIQISQLSESTAQRLEEKGLLRDALNHWRLIRDDLLQKTSIDHIRLKEQQSSVLDFSSTVSYEKHKTGIAFAEQKIEQLENRVRQAANEHFENSIRYFSKRDVMKGRHELLKALYLNPEFEKARNLLYQEISRPDYVEVAIKAGDTSKMIAKKTYKNASLSSLVSYYADKRGGLVSGMKLKLPKLKPESIRKPPIKKPRPVKTKKYCGVEIVKPRNKLADYYLTMAEEYFNKDKIRKAINSIQISVCLNPDNASAVQLYQLLKTIEN